MFALAANHLPSSPIVIAAEIGVDQVSGNRVLAERLKKILRTRARPEWPPRRSGIFIQGSQNFVLLFSRQAGEFRDARKHLTHSRLQIREPLAVRLLVFGAKRGQPTIDKIDDTGFACAGSLVRRNDAGCDRFDLRRLLWSEKLKFWRRRRLRSLMRVRRGGQQGRPIRRNPRGAETCSCSQ